MDLTARVAALEEEVTILKGEIKTILQELRTAVLARENPFAGNGHDPGSMPTRQEPTLFDSVFSEPAPTPPPAPNIVMLKDNSGPAAMSAPEPGVVAAPQAAGKPAGEAGLAMVSADQVDFLPERLRRRWSIHSLAALMAWTQEASQRFSHGDMGIVLSLARYGGLLDADLEDTLGRLAKQLAPAERPPKAGSTDFLLALRQLDALLDEALDTAEPPARRAS